MEELTFSVAIITYNQEIYISQTLDSILNQEHNYPYEIVIGEDCSTDGTRKVIEEYVKKYPNIIKPLFNEKNLGLIKNYFNVINHCIGTYIMECAGDDYWLPGKVEKQLKYMKCHSDIGMCYSKAFVWNEKKQCYLKKKFGSKKETLKQLLIGNNIPAPSVCFRSELIKDYLVSVDPLKKTWIVEDYPMWLWFSKVSKIKFLHNNTFCVYREIEGSASHTVNIKKEIELQKCYSSIRSFFYESKQKYEHNDSEIVFNIYWNHYIRKLDNIKLMNIEKMYCKIQNKTIKIRIKMFLAKNIFTRCFLSKLLR